jgi:squalene-hopene/tetraprenyl-beta-curcumene cyclase
MDALEQTLDRTRRALLEARVPAGHWEGRLSSSALSTATAVCALELLRRRQGGDERRVAAGLAWLAAHANRDGGYGDTVDSPSNISTTALCWAALGLRPELPGAADAFARTEAWMRREAGSLLPADLARTVSERYGIDRTFSAPILTMAALAGRFGDGPEAWDAVPPLPFELAALPRGLFAVAGLPVVSYALPALIAIGLVRHVRRPSANPAARFLRAAVRGRVLRVLESILPSSGGFLEATPLTSFVAMSLAGAGLHEHPVARAGAAFLEASAREDGSWPIDTNLATWTTTLAVQALGEALPREARPAIRGWLLRQQTRAVHPYTGSAPGAWAWTDLPGGVPDADDTPGALLALHALREGGDPEALRAAQAGVRWLLELQNADGGIPTFCRGWGKLPFDRSCPDLTAHALRAWHVWKPDLGADLAARIEAASARAFAYLAASQSADGSWIPLWFGNQRSPKLENPVYGTARVLLCTPLPSADGDWKAAAARGFRWLRDAQHADGPFGGAPGVDPSIEETALAVEALALHDRDAARRGAAWLADRTRRGEVFEAAPIGLYFAKLWYSERLYPTIFTAAALARAVAAP